MTRCVYLTLLRRVPRPRHTRTSRAACITDPAASSLAVVRRARRLPQPRTGASATHGDRSSYVEPPVRPSRPVDRSPTFDITLRGVLVSCSWSSPSASPRRPTSTLDAKELEGAQRRSPSAAAQRGRPPFLVNKYYLDHLYENVIVARHQGPHRPGRLLVQPARDRRRRQRRSARAPVARRSSSTRTSTRRWSTARSTASPTSTGEAGGDAAQPPDRHACSDAR